MTQLNVSDLPKFGAALRSRRMELRLKSSQVARGAGIPRSTYCNLEEGRYLPSLPVYQKLCLVLKLSPGKLLNQ
jgi:DNA-binding XRE family transcriptional regulator